MNNFLAILQAASFLVLAVTVYVSFRQLKAATEQARASVDQAKSSAQMAELSMKQTEITRAQFHASFKPIVEATGGKWESHGVTFTFTNEGPGPALSVVAISRDGSREELGNMAPGNSRTFLFLYQHNMPVQHIGPPLAQSRSVTPSQSVPLRLEYRSVSGAKYWTNIDFKPGADYPTDPKHEHGMEFC